MAGIPKPPRSEWLIAKRKSRGETVEDVARLVGRDADTIRGWEAGRPPKRADDASFAILERHYDSKAPTNATPEPDQSALVAALAAQTEAITALVEELRLARERDLDAAAAILRAAELMRPPTPGGVARSTKRGAPLGTTG